MADRPNGHAGIGTAMHDIQGTYDISNIRT